MKQELFEYATSFKARIEQAKIGSFRSLIVLVCFLDGLFLLPTFVVNLWLGIASYVLLVVSIVVTCRENDYYAKTLFLIGSCLFFMFFGAVLGMADMFSMGNFFAFLIPAIVIVYEIIILIKLKFKMYSLENETAKTFKKITYCGAFVSVFAGRRLGRMLSNFSWGQWLVGCAVLVFLIVALFFIQRYVIYKIYTRKKLY